MKKLIFKKEINSTNTYLKENYDCFEHFTICYTNHQTKGKGRISHNWYDEKGKNLLMSILLKDVEVADLTFVNDNNGNLVIEFNDGSITLDKYFEKLGDCSVRNLIDSTGKNYYIGNLLEDIIIERDSDYDYEINGTYLSESLVGDDNNDTIYGRLGNDTLNGNDGNDKLLAGDGDDVVYGGDGNDELYGENGNNILIVLGQDISEFVKIDSDTVDILKIDYGQK